MTLQSAYARLRLFRQSFEDGLIDEESGLTTQDVDAVLEALGPEATALRIADWLDKHGFSDTASAVTRSVRLNMRGEEPGIPVYRHPDATDDIRPTCVTCGQSFDLQDPEQVAYHDQEGEHPPMG